MAVLWSCSPYNIEGVNINDLRKYSLKFYKKEMGVVKTIA